MNFTFGEFLRLDVRLDFSPCAQMNAKLTTLQFSINNALKMFQFKQISLKFGPSVFSVGGVSFESWQERKSKCMNTASYARQGVAELTQACVLLTQSKSEIFSANGKIALCCF